MAYKASIVFTLFCASVLIFSQNGKYAHAADDTALHVPVNTGLSPALQSLDSSMRDIVGRLTTQTDILQRLLYTDESSIRTFLSANPGPKDSAALFLPGTTPTAGGGKSDTPVLACATRAITNPDAARALPGGAWEKLIKSGEVDPTSYAGVRVNDSSSLSCLLQEIVEQNKLALNLQIHQLLNEHIRAAQAKAFANQAQNMTIAANIEWMRKGNIRTKIDENGEVVEEKLLSVFDDPESLQQDTIERETDALVRLLLGGDELSSQVKLAPGIDPYRVARNIVMEMRSEKSSQKENAIRIASCDVLAPLSAGGLGFESEDAFLRFMGGDTSVYKGSYTAVLRAMQANPACTENGVASALRSLIQSRSTRITEKLEADRMANNGIQSIYKCKDADCSETVVALPGSAVSSIFNMGITAQERRLENVENDKDLSAIEGNESISTSLFISGIQGFNTDQLGNTSVDAAIGKFHDAIKNGYFDLQGGTTDWALGAMLQMYDQLVGREGEIRPDSNTQGQGTQ